jgi:hypothetical protein
VRSPKLGPITIGNVGYVVACMAAAITLAVAGYAHEIVGLTDGLGSQVTAQAPGLEMFGADSVNASDYVSAAGQNDQSVPADVQAAANAGSQSDVPAYSQAHSARRTASRPARTNRR